MNTKLYQNLTDSQLVKLYTEGNNNAFAQLLTRHKNRIYDYILYTVHNTELAEDLFQETFVKAIVSLQNHTYEDNGYFSAWLLRIAHNLIIDHYRHLNNENTISNDDYDYDLLNNADLTEGNIEDTLIHHQQLTEAVQLLAQLPEEQQQVVKMRIYDDLSFNEIADLTGVSINTALGRMRYAILNLRRLATEHSLV